MGEALAKNEMFVFFVRILQRLRIETTGDIPDPNKFAIRVTKVPDPFYVKISSKDE